jgi:hypothetical protein
MESANFDPLWVISPEDLMSSQKRTLSLVKQGKFKVGVVPADGLGHLLYTKTIF